MITAQKLQKKRERREAKRRFFKSMKRELGENGYVHWKSNRWKRKAEKKFSKQIG